MNNLNKMEREYKIGDEVTIHRKVVSGSQNENEWQQPNYENVIGKSGKIKSKKLFDGTYRVDFEVERGYFHPDCFIPIDTKKRSELFDKIKKKTLIPA